MARRRAKGEGSLFRRADGKWVAEVVVQRDSNGGARTTVRRRRAVANTKGEAAERLREMLLRYKRGYHAGTFSEYLRLWLAEGRQSWKPATYVAVEGWVRNHIAPRFGARRISDIRTDDVRMWLQEMEAGGIGPTTRKRALQIAAQALRPLVDEGKCPSNPFALVRRPKVPRPDVYVPNVAEFPRILAAANDLQTRVLILLAATTMLRIGELLALQWQDFDFAKKTLRVKATLGRDYDGSVKRLSPKTQSSLRVVALPELIMPQLTKLRKQNARARNAAAGSAWVFCNAQGGPMERHNFRTRVWLPLLRRAGVQSMHFHALRHFGDSMLLDNGVPILVVAARMGQSDTRMTLDRYGHIVRAGADREAAQVTDRIYRDLLSGHGSALDVPDTSS